MAARAQEAAICVTADCMYDAVLQGSLFIPVCYVSFHLTYGPNAPLSTGLLVQHKDLTLVL
jgi:hypothetical protein